MNLNPYDSPNGKILKPQNTARYRPWLFLFLSIGLALWGGLVLFFGIFVGPQLFIPGLLFTGTGVLNVVVGITNSRRRLMALVLGEGLVALSMAAWAFIKGGMEAAPMAVFIVVTTALLALSLLNKSKNKTKVPGAKNKSHP